jgi:hypothetical protein
MTKHDENSPCIDKDEQELCEWAYDGVSTPVAADWYCKTCGAVDIYRNPPNAVLPKEYMGEYERNEEYRRLKEASKEALDAHVRGRETGYALAMRDQIAFVRQAILHCLDDASPRTPGLAWDFNDDEQRMDFADQVVAWLAAREKLDAAEAEGARRHKLLEGGRSEADVEYVRTKLQQRADKYYLETYREHFYCNGDAALDEEAANLLGILKT